MDVYGCIAFLTVTVLAAHGFHPAAEDGGIYIAGIYLRLNPGLFPHDAEFVRAPMAYSSFAAMMAGASRILHLPADWTIFWAHLLTIALTLCAAKRVSEKCGHNAAEQLGAIALLAAWWTMPVAGTSLNIGDPYVTARSFSTPLSLLAVSFALEPWHDESKRWLWRPLLLCLLYLVSTAFMHELMFGFAVTFIVLLRAKMSHRWRPLLAILTLLAIGLGFVLSMTARPESTAFVRAELSREYWFLSQWSWYEVCGLLAPLLLFGALMKMERSKVSTDLLSASLVAGLASLLVAVLFARERFAEHLVARLQPLRMFTLLYAVLTIYLGAHIVRYSRTFLDRSRLVWSKRLFLMAPTALFILSACAMFIVQKVQFSSSPHIELPASADTTRNPWVAAFRWIRQNTAEDALFAIDAEYIHQPHNDAQTFRATALRSVLPDQSKDGGEAAVDSALADQWQIGTDAQTNLNTLDDADREARLRPLGATWIVLTARSPTSFPCPYNNGEVKVCRLNPRS